MVQESNLLLLRQELCRVQLDPHPLVARLRQLRLDELCFSNSAHDS